MTFRLWIVASVLWVAFWAIMEASFGRAFPLGWYIIPPVVLLAVWAALAWALGGVR